MDVAGYGGPMPADPAVRPSAARRPALDGLRAVAVSSVACYHFGGGATSALPGGFLGVDVFFVLSGYLITGLLLAELRRTGRVDLAGFWARRVRRLLPAAGLMIAAVSLYTWWAVPPQNWPARRGDLLWTIGYAANWHFLAAGEDYFAAYAGASPLRHTWSLAIEEQFYLVWPVAVLLAAWGWRRVAASGRLRAGGPGGTPGRRWSPGATVAVAGLCVAVAASVLAMAVQFTPGDPNRAYYGTDGRAQELLMGALGAVLLPRLALRGRAAASAAVGGLAALLLAFVTLHDGSPVYYRGGALGVSVATLAVLAGVETAPGSAVGRLLSWRPAVALGRISYGVYLWHWPVSIAWPLPAGAGLPQAAAVQAGRVLVTLLVAGASYRWLEQPVLRGRVAWVRRSRARLAVAAVGTVLVLVAGADAATALPDGLGAQLADAADRPCPGESITDLRVCLHGAGPGAPELMLLGDSTARALAPGLDVATAAEGRPWVQAAWQRCTPTGAAGGAERDDRAGRPGPGVRGAGPGPDRGSARALPPEARARHRVLVAPPEPARRRQAAAARDAGARGGTAGGEHRARPAAHRGRRRGGVHRPVAAGGVSRPGGGGGAPGGCRLAGPGGRVRGGVQRHVARGGGHGSAPRLGHLHRRPALPGVPLRRRAAGAAGAGRRGARHRHVLAADRAGGAAPGAGRGAHRQPQQVGDGRASLTSEGFLDRYLYSWGMPGHWGSVNVGSSALATLVLAGGTITTDTGNRASEARIVGGADYPGGTPRNPPGARVMQLRSARWLVVITALLAVTACSAGGGSNVGAVASGPLGSLGEVDGEECVGASPGSTVTLGGEVLRNHGAVAVTMDGSSLEAAHGMEIVDSQVVPIADNTLIGFLRSYPPDSHSSTIPSFEETWAKRLPLGGFRLAPGEERNLVLGVKFTQGSRATAQRIMVTYHQGGDKYILKFVTAYSLQPSCT